MPSLNRSEIVAVIIILVLASFWRIGYVAFYPSPEINRYQGDDIIYLQIARNIADGNGYSSDFEPPYRPNGLRLPAYPFFIAGIISVFGDSVKAIIIANALLDIATACIIFFLALYILQSAKVAIAVFSLTLLCLPTWHWLGRILPDMLAVFLSAGVLALWYASEIKSAKYSFFLGLASMFLVFTRPEYAVLAFIIFVWLIWRRKNIKCAGLFAAGLLLVAIPWTMRNFIAFDTPTPLVRGGGKGLTLWFATWEQHKPKWGQKGEIRIFVEDGVPRWVPPPQSYDSEAEKELTQNALNAYAEYVYANPDITVSGEHPDDVLWRLATERIKRDPARYIRLCVKRFPLFWHQKFLPIPRVPSEPIIKFYLSAIFGVGTFLGFILFAKNARWLPVLLFVAYTAFIHFPFCADPRYLLPAYPMIFMLGAASLRRVGEVYGKNLYGRI